MDKESTTRLTKSIGNIVLRTHSTKNSISLNSPTISSMDSNNRNSGNINVNNNSNNMNDINNDESTSFRDNNNNNIDIDDNDNGLGSQRMPLMSYINKNNENSNNNMIINNNNINNNNNNNNNSLNIDMADSSKNIDKNDSSNKYETNATLFVRYFFLVSILLQNSSFTLLRRYNKGVLHDGASNASILIGGEFMKIFVSLFMGIRTYMYNHEGTNKKLINYFRILVQTSPKLIFPAFIYLCMNWLSLLSLERIDASTFTVIAQCKTLSTALAGYFFLNKRFSGARVRSLIHLVCSVIVITYVANNSMNNSGSSSNNNDVNTENNENSARFMVGVLFVLIEVSLSGCVSVYYEKVLKDDSNRLSVWDRNIQLATFSIIMYFYSFANDGYFNDWSFITFCVSFLGALGGVLVAFSIKYTDSVLKAMSTSCAIVLTSILSALWLDGPYNIPIAVSSISVVVSIFTYVTDGKMCSK